MSSLKISLHNHALPKVRWQPSLKFHFCSLNKVTNNVLQDLRIVLLPFFRCLGFRKCVVKTEVELQFLCVSNFRGQLFVANSTIRIPNLNHVSNNFTKRQPLVRCVIIPFTNDQCILDYNLIIIILPWLVHVHARIKKLLTCGLAYYKKGESSVHSSGLLLEYSGTVWAFAPVSGLLQLHPDGSICSISDLHALSLFGYNKDELLQKVSQFDLQNTPSAIKIRSVLTFVTAALLTEHYISGAWLL